MIEKHFRLIFSSLFVSTHLKSTFVIINYYLRMPVSSLLRYLGNTLSHITVTADGIFTKRSLLLRSNLLLVIKSFYKHGESEEDPSHDFALLWQGEARAKNYLWGLTTEREREREREDILKHFI